MQLKRLLLLLFSITPFYSYSQSSVKIKPVQQSESKWGYQDLLGRWIISPQFVKSYSFNNENIASVIISEKVDKIIPVGGYNTSLFTYIRAYIDLNGDILVKYTSEDSQRQKDKKYNKALKMVLKRNATGVYDNVYTHLAQVDSIIIVRRQREQARQDSILAAKRVADSIALVKKRQADSIAIAKIEAKRVADSIALVKKRQSDSIKVVQRTQNRISSKKIRITGDGLLLKREEKRRMYSITREGNRNHIAHDADAEIYAILDVKKVIHDSDLWLLSDNLFHSVDISKLTIEIMRGGVKKKLGAFMFAIRINLKDMNDIYESENELNTLWEAICQVDEYISSFKELYQNKAYLIEPLYAVDVYILDKEGRGASIEEIKIECNKAKKKLEKQM